MSFEFTMRRGGGNKRAERGTFRIAVCGNFSGRSGADDPEPLGARRGIRIDPDSFDRVMQRMEVRARLSSGEEGDMIEIPATSLDSFSPDELYRNVEVFQVFADLRRRLRTPATFDAAAREIQALAGVTETGKKPAEAEVSGDPAEGASEFTGFEDLLKGPALKKAHSVVAQDIIRAIVEPHVVARPDPRLQDLEELLDQATSAAMRRILHDPGFQACEAAWRSVDLLVRSICEDESVNVMLHDMTRDELAADLDGAAATPGQGLAGLLGGDGAAPAPTLVLLLFSLPADASGLARLASLEAVGRHLDSPILLSVPVQEALAGFDASRVPEARYIGVATNRFMLRLPYGRNSDPVDAFGFEEMAGAGGEALLLGEPATLVALIYGRTFIEEEAPGTPPTMSEVDDLPVTTARDRDGDLAAIGPLEAVLTEAQAAALASHGLMPLVGRPGNPSAHAAAIQSLSGKPLPI